MTLTIVWRIVIWLWVVSEAAIGIGTHAKKGTANVRDRGSLILLWIVIGVATFAAGAVREIQGEPLPLSSRWAKGIGLAILAAGLVLRWSAIATLGRYFTSNVAIHEGQKVLRTGVYRFMRHPSYTGLWLALIRLAIHFRNWWSLAITLIPVTAAILYRIHVEEAALIDAFGSEYEDYRKSTSRLVPGLY
jgi:protein-S-isoprenylcysteine O-methyltransferase Ste14